MLKVRGIRGGQRTAATVDCPSRAVLVASSGGQATHAEPKILTVVLGQVNERRSARVSETRKSSVLLLVEWQARVSRYGKPGAARFFRPPAVAISMTGGRRE